MTLPDELPPGYPPGYPRELHEVAYLDDGTTMEFRAIVPEDTVRLERLFHRLSPETVYRRFFTSVHRIDHKRLAYLATVDYVDRLAIVAVVDDEIIGVARYDRLAGVHQPHEAETALLVEDAWQRRGIGTRLMWRLTAAAMQRGVTEFTADVLAQNRPMMGLLRAMAEEVQVVLEGTEYRIRIRLATVIPRP